MISIPLSPSGLEPLDHLTREQQPVGDDVDQHLHAARLARRVHPLREVVEHRHVQRRLAAEEREEVSRFGVMASSRDSIHVASRSAISIDIFAAVLL